MCRGLAVGVDIVTNEVICIGKSSHTDTIGNREDNCIKLEIIVNEESEKGFYVELDEQYFVNGKLEKKIKEKFGKWLTASEGMSEKLNRIIEDWIENNKLQIYKWLLFCQSYHKGEKIYNSHQEGEKIYNNSQKGKKIDNSSQEGKKIDNSSQKGEEIYNSSQEGEEIYNHCQKGEEIYNSSQKGKKIDNSYQEGEEIYNHSQKGEKIYNNSQKGEEINNNSQEGEEIYNHSQKGEKINNSYQEGKKIDNYSQKGEEIYNSYQEGEKIYIAFTKTGIQEISDWIKTKSEENTQLTLADLVQIIINFENKDN